MYNSLISLIIGFFIDLLVGDPNYSWHPIRMIGRLITVLEKILPRVFPKTKSGELIAGFFLMVITASVATAIPTILLIFIYKWNRYAGILIESIFCWQLLATKSLRAESMKVYYALKGNDITKARTAVSMIVGRDTKNLTEAGITKAAVETVAENTSDGSIAPMLFLALGGAGLGFFYKAINTMDSMVGYKNDTYLYFGRVAAKTDDLLNYIPSRLSAYLMILAAFIRKFSSIILGNKIENEKISVINAFKIFRRDRYNHASPNSAQTEAVMAGALQVQLAGDAYYFGKKYEKKTIGDDTRPIEFEDIPRANSLLYITAILGLVLLSILKVLLCNY